MISPLFANAFMAYLGPITQRSKTLFPFSTTKHTRANPGSVGRTRAPGWRQFPFVLVAAAFISACSTDGEANDGPMVEGAAIGVEGAHEHGVARLGLAVDGTEVTLDMQAPADAFFGFEHTPSTDEEIAHVLQVLDRMRAEAGGLLSLPAESSCMVGTIDILEAPDVSAEGDHAHDDDEAGHDGPDTDEGHDEEGHDDHDDEDHPDEGDEAEHDEGEGHDHDEEEPAAEGEDHEHDEDGHSDVRLTVSWTCSESPEGQSASLQVGNLLADVEFVDLTVITSMGQAAARVAPGASFSF